MLNEKEIFCTAFELSDIAARARYLEEACGENRPLRARVETLLRARTEDPEFLDALPPEAVADMASVPLPGETLGYFGDYVLLDVIASGGTGVVFRARQTSLNRVVALKMLRDRPLLLSESDTRRFRGEAEAAASLDHPNIVPIYEVGAHEGQAYFSMKLIEGGTLHSHAAELHTDPRQAAALIAKTARAVHYAHTTGLLHRDLKPGNILVDAAGEPHVTDFGLARKMGVESGMTVTGQIMGTPHYMAPEQARGENRQITAAADIYSLGAMLYEVLAGRKPFDGEDIVTLLKQVSETPPAPIRTRHPSVSRDLETIVMKCLEKASGARYSTAAALADDLERWLRGEPIMARPAGPAERLVKWARRRPMHAAVAGMAALLVLTFGIAGFLLSRPPSRPAVVRSGITPASGPEIVFDGHRYQFMTGAVSHEEAGLFAEEMGGRLATPVGEAAFFSLVNSPLPADIPAGRWCWMADGLLVDASSGPDERRRPVATADASWRTDCHGFVVEWDHAAPNAPAPLAGAGADGWVDLMAGLDLPITGNRGVWRRTPEGMRVERETLDRYSFMEFLSVLPDEFDYEIEFTVHSGAGAYVSQFFPTPVPGHWIEARLSSLAMQLGTFIDGKSPWQSEVSASEWLIDPGKRHRSRLEVRRASVRLVVDDEPLIQWFGSFRRLTPKDDKVYHNTRRPCLAIYQTEVTFHRVRVRAATGHPEGGSFVRRRPPAGEPGSVLHVLTSADWKWEGPVNAGGQVNSENIENQASLTADGLEIYFKRVIDGKDKLYFCRRSRADAPFGEAQPIAELNSSAGEEGDPFIVPDGLTIVFTRDDIRHPERYFDIAESRRSDGSAAWGTPVLFDGGDNSFDSQPALSSDSRSLVFHRGPGDLCISRRPSLTDAFPAAEKLTGFIESNAKAYSPFLCSDGHTLLFQRSYAQRENALFATVVDGTRTTGLWRLDLPVTTYTDGPWLSADGLTLWVAADYPGTRGAMDLWYFRRVKK